MAQGCEEHCIPSAAVRVEMILMNSLRLRFTAYRMSEKERIEYQRRRAEEIFMSLFHARQLAKQRAEEMAKTVEVGCDSAAVI